MAAEPSPAPLHDSIAAAEFASARARLREMRLQDRRRPLPLTYQPPGGRHGGEPVDDPSAEPTPETAGAGGPIGRSLHDLADGSLSVKHLVDESLEAIARRDPELNAIAYLLADEAMAEAERLDGELRDGRPRRPLHGIPITVKDVIDVGGAETRCGSAAYADVPSADAAAVARLRAAGAIVIAKTTTHEFALGVTNPQSRNPHDPSRIPGGSSGGSTIAVATGMGLGSLGTDTRASIRVPAALSGTVGFKPTFGRVPTAGVVSLSWTMDHVAPMATTVADAARLMDVLLGSGSLLARRADAGRTTTRTGTPWRVGVPAAGFTGDDPAVDAVVRRAIDTLAGLGADVVDVDRPSATDFDDANALGLLISRAEAATFHRGIGTDLSMCWAEINDQLSAAQSIPAIDYLAAQRRRGELADRFLSLFDATSDDAGIDVLALPTASVTAPPVDDFAAYLMLLSRNAIPWSLVGFPAISIPCGVDGHGLPVGLQLVARPDAEATLVEVGAAYEAARA